MFEFHKRIGEEIKRMRVERSVDGSYYLVNIDILLNVNFQSGNLVQTLNFMEFHGIVWNFH